MACVLFGRLALLLSFSASLFLCSLECVRKVFLGLGRAGLLLLREQGNHLHKIGGVRHAWLICLDMEKVALHVLANSSRVKSLPAVHTSDSLFVVTVTTRSSSCFYLFLLSVISFILVRFHVRCEGFLCLALAVANGARPLARPFLLLGCRLAPLWPSYALVNVVLELYLPGFDCIVAMLLSLFVGWHGLLHSAMSGSAGKRRPLEPTACHSPLPSVRTTNTKMAPLCSLEDVMIQRATHGRSDSNTYTATIHSRLPFSQNNKSRDKPTQTCEPFFDSGTMLSNTLQPTRRRGSPSMLVSKRASNSLTSLFLTPLYNMVISETRRERFELTAQAPEAPVSQLERTWRAWLRLKKTAKATLSFLPSVCVCVCVCVCACLNLK